MDSSFLYKSAQVLINVPIGLFLVWIEFAYCAIEDLVIVASDATGLFAHGAHMHYAKYTVGNVFWAIASATVLFLGFRTLLRFIGNRKPAWRPRNVALAFYVGGILLNVAWIKTRYALSGRISNGILDRLFKS